MATAAIGRSRESAAWRMNRRRLEAEAIRDALLSAAGRLDPLLGGPAFKPLAEPRRTVYLMSVRTGPTDGDFGRVFDRADPGSIVDRRGQSVVAPQALFFMNDPWVIGLSRALAQRVVAESLPNNDSRIRHLYCIVLGRQPTMGGLEGRSEDACSSRRRQHLGAPLSHDFVHE